VSANDDVLADLGRTTLSLLSARAIRNETIQNQRSVIRIIWFCLHFFMLPHTLQQRAPGAYSIQAIHVIKTIMIFESYCSSGRVFFCSEANRILIKPDEMQCDA
jgi:hypothetical protein